MMMRGWKPFSAQQRLVLVACAAVLLSNISNVQSPKHCIVIPCACHVHNARITDPNHPSHAHTNTHMRYVTHGVHRIACLCQARAHTRHSSPDIPEIVGRHAFIGPTSSNVGGDILLGTRQREE